jgi:hypothetical protein
MASRVWQIGIPILGAFALTLGCLQASTSEGTTFGNTDIGTSGFDTFEAEGAEFEGGNEGVLGDCGQYIEACEQDPYCVCYLDCVVQNALAGSDNPLAGCLEKCQLAAVPYWAEQILVCFEGDPPLPEPDTTGEEGQDTGFPGTTGATTTGSDTNG